MIGRRQAFMSTLWAAAFLTTAVGIRPANAEEFRGYTYIPVNTLESYKGMVRIGDRIAQETQNRITMRLATGGSLPIKASDITQAVGIGTVDFASDGFFMGVVPAGGILRLPMLLNTPEEFAKALDILNPHLEREFERKGVKLLAHYRYPLQIAWSTAEFRSFDDLKSKKIRVTSSEQGEFVRAFGGIPVTLGSPEVATAFQTGVISGAFTSTSAGGNIWKDFIKFNYRFGPNWFNSVIIMNKAKFDGLPKAVQERVLEIAKEEGAAITRNLAVEEAKLGTEFEQEGKIVVIHPTPQQVEDATERMKEFWDKWAAEKGGEIPALLASVKAAIGK